MIKLYHGTSSCKLEAIHSEGLINPFLTSSLDLAMYYAETATDEDEGDYLILQVEVEEKNLRYDGNAMDEPVSVGVISIKELEALVRKKFNTLSLQHPEWIKDGYLIIPATEYKASLEVVASCWHEGVIKSNHFQVSSGDEL